MNWFKIKIADGKEGGQIVVGCSEDCIEELIEKITKGQYIRLDQLLYKDGKEIKNWEQWDASLIPTAFINPNKIEQIMQFKGDPRTTPS